MLLALTNTASPATDLGFLLHKHPDRAQRYPLSFGAAHVFYPEAGEARCTACLLVEVDPIDLVRGKAKTGGLPDQYVNDRPYAASSFLSVAIGQVFSTALAGRCAVRPELATRPLPLTAHLPVAPARGDEARIRAVLAELEIAGTETMIDLGCGDGKLLSRLLKDRRFARRRNAHLGRLFGFMD